MPAGESIRSYLTREELAKVRADALAEKDDGGPEGYWAGRVLQVFTALDELETLARELENLREAQQKETRRLVHLVVRHGSDAKTTLGHLADYPACCTTPERGK